MTNLEKLIDTLQNAPIENTACFILTNADTPCDFCAYSNEPIYLCVRKEDNETNDEICLKHIKQWLESEVS